MFYVVLWKGFKPETDFYFTAEEENNNNNGGGLIVEQLQGGDFWELDREVREVQTLKLNLFNNETFKQQKLILPETKVHG